MSSELGKLKAGIDNFKRGNFLEAIQILEEVCREYEIEQQGTFREYRDAQVNLVKAYIYAENKPQAILCCKKLAVCENKQVRDWARKVLSSISPESLVSLKDEDELEKKNPTQFINSPEEATKVLLFINEEIQNIDSDFVIKTLQSLLEIIEPNTKEYLYAQILLIEAYHSQQSLDSARLIAKQLMDSKHYLTHMLVNNYLMHSTLDITNFYRKATSKSKYSLNAIEASNIFQLGYKSILNKDYKAAIQAFITYSQQASSKNKEFLQANKWLVKAYQEIDDMDAGIKLCQELLVSKHYKTRRFAREQLFTIFFTENSALVISPKKEETPNSVLDAIPERVTTLSSDINIEDSEDEQQSKSFIFKYRSLDEFKNFSKKKLLPELRKFEKLRKKSLVSIYIANSIFIFVTYILIRYFPFKFLPDINVRDENIIYIHVLSKVIVLPSLFLGHLIVFTLMLLIFLFIEVICFFLWASFYNSAFDTFAGKYNAKVIGKILEFINTNRNFRYSQINYDNTVGKVELALQNSQIFYGVLQPNSVTQNNQIYGTINNINLSISNVSLATRINHKFTNIFNNISLIDNRELYPAEVARLIISSISFVFPFPFILLHFWRLIKGFPYLISKIFYGNNIDFERFKNIFLTNDAYYQDIFRGLFFYAKFNKSTKAATIIKPKILKSNLNTINPLDRKQIVKLEDPEFAKYFNVYSEDQIQARYILSTNLMEKLARFRKKIGRNVYVSFVEDTIYIAIEYPEGIFEPNLYRSMLRFAPLREYFEAIQLMIGIIEELNLDCYIWQKPQPKKT
jgi:hypothetical protein